MATATKDKKTAKVTKTAKSTGDDVGARIAKMRENKTPWATIAEELGIGAGKAQLLYLQHQVAPSDRIEGRNEADLAKRIVSARDNQKLSWGAISARSGLTESRCRRIYEDTTGTPALGNRIGKGGRYASEADRPVKEPKAAKTPKAAKAAKAESEAPKRVSAEQAKVSIGDMDLKQLKDRLNGKVITVNNEGGGTRKIAVKAVKSLRDGELRLTDKDGNATTVLVAHIAKATR